MTATRITTLVEVSDNADYVPNFGELPTTQVTNTNAFVLRYEFTVSGPTSASGTPLLLAGSGAVRVLLHNKSTTNKAVLYLLASPSTSLMALGPGETLTYQVPADTDPAIFGMYADTSSALVLLMAWAA